MHEIYTDGACHGNPGPGGFGVIMINEGQVEFSHNEYCENTTNNREELKAIICALDYADTFLAEEQVLICSDSAYCVNMINDWIWKWANNDWKNSKKQTVENLDLVQTIYNYINKDFYHCQVIKVKGHNNCVENELADALATHNIDKYNYLLEINNIYDPSFELNKKYNNGDYNTLI